MSVDACSLSMDCQLVRSQRSALSMHSGHVILRIVGRIDTYWAWSCEEGLLTLLTNTCAGSKPFYQHSEIERIISLTYMSDSIHTLTRCE